MVGFAVVTGISEEIYFRLALPLLLLPLTGNVFWAFGIGSMIFGAFDLYQGARGVIQTAIVGLYLSAIYVGSGQLWVIVVLHALMNLNSTILRPRRMARVAGRS